MYFRTSTIILPGDLNVIPIFPGKANAPSYLIMHEKEYTKNIRNITPIILSKVIPNIKLEGVGIVCYSLEQLYEYIRAPYSDYKIRYNVVGFKGVRKLQLHTLLKGSHITKTERKIDYCKIDLSKGAISVQQCKVKSCLDPIISTGYLAKNNLHRLGDFVPYCTTLSNFHYTEGVYIAKPIGKASSGEGITVFSTEDELERAKEIIYSKWKQGIVCDYINNPLLFDGRKFHLRVYLFISTIGLSSLFKEAKIITAGLPYKNEDYTNRDIHDTHLQSTNKDYFFTKDFPYNRKLVWPQIEDIATAVSNVPFGGYREAKVSYDVLGLDILIDDNFKCWLLEVNFSPSMRSIDYSDYTDFEKQFLTWEFNLIKQLL